MNKLYHNLYTVLNNFKKHSLCISLSLLILLTGKYVNAQNPTVTINQPAAQPDPTNTAPINFTVVFDQPVIGFATGDVVITGTASGPFASVVTGGPVTYNVTVSGMTSCGTVIANIPAGVCTNTLTQPNLASTSTDNTVTFGGLPTIVNVTPITSCGGVAGSGVPCTPLTASGNADTYMWSPLTGLFMDCAHTIPYTGTNTTTVYAAPTVHTVYTVTGTMIATGCINFATATVKYTPPAPVVTPSSVNMCLGAPPVKLKVTQGIPAGPAIWSPAAGLFMDQAATIPYLGTPTDSVWARPSPSGVYTYQVTAPGIPGPPIWVKNPAAIAIPVGGAASLYPSNVSLFVLPVTGARVRSVVLHDVSHTRSSDIDVLLQSPSGQNVMLMSDVGGVNAINNATYTFADWSAFMNLTTANPTGTYTPINSGSPDNFPAPGPGSVNINSGLNTFTGNFNGTWKLFVVDDDGTSDQGLIAGGYTINFDTAAYCYSPPRSVTVTVGNAVSITSQPVDQHICLGNSATFSVGVTGAGPFAYQWQQAVGAGGPWTNLVNAGPFSGVNTNTLTITSPPVTMSGYYYRVAVGGCSNISSNAALLTVNPLPAVTITANPLVIGPTQTSTITSTVTPNPAATYTWYYNNAVIPGATSSSLVVNYGSPGDYQLKVVDVNGCTNLSNIETIANSFASNVYTYPNPSGGVFQARYHSEPNTVLYRFLIVYNNRGENILTIPFKQTVPYQKIDVDISAHGPGLYWVELRNNIGRREAVNKVVVVQ